MRKGGLTCRFYCDAKLLVEKHWHTAPQPGEVVMLKRAHVEGVAPDNKLYAYKVVGRIFMGEGAPFNCQLLNIYIEREGWSENSDDT